MTPELADSIIAKVDTLLDDLFEISEDAAGREAVQALGEAMSILIGGYPDFADAVAKRISEGGVRDGS